MTYVNASGACQASEKVISFPQPGYLILKCLRLKGSLEDKLNPSSPVTCIKTVSSHGVAMRAVELAILSCNSQEMQATVRVIASVSVKILLLIKKKSKNCSIPVDFLARYCSSLHYSFCIIQSLSIGNYSLLLCRYSKLEGYAANGNENASRSILEQCESESGVAFSVFD